MLGIVNDGISEKLFILFLDIVSNFLCLILSK